MGTIRIFSGQSVLLILCLCLARLALAAGGPPTLPPGVPVDPDYAQAEKAITEKDWAGAIRLLNQAATRQESNADIYNLLGYAERNQGHLDAAFKYYEKALQLNPKHRGAHEYVGEAYLMIDNLLKAEEHLAALDKLCFFPCDEYTDLKKKIAAYRSAHK